MCRGTAAAELAATCIFSDKAGGGHRPALASLPQRRPPLVVKSVGLKPRAFEFNAQAVIFCFYSHGHVVT